MVVSWLSHLAEKRITQLDNRVGIKEKEFRHTDIADLLETTAGCVTQGAGDVGLAGAGSAFEDDIASCQQQSDLLRFALAWLAESDAAKQAPQEGQ